MFVVNSVIYVLFPSVAGHPFGRTSFWRRRVNKLPAICCHFNGCKFYEKNSSYQGPYGWLQSYYYFLHIYEIFL